MESKPIFINDVSTDFILRETRDSAPEGGKIYIFGGTLRNALFYEFYNEKLTQRDYDCIVLGDGEKFMENLLQKGFVLGKKNTPKSKVFKKARIENPSHEFDDWVYLDCKIFNSEESIFSILSNITDFTISGLALDINDVWSPVWLEKIIMIPNTLDDIKNKKLRMVRPYSISIYKIIRMMHIGFHSPSKEDIVTCLEKLKEADPNIIDREIKKTNGYVGDKDRLQEILKKINIEPISIGF